MMIIEYLQALQRSAGLRATGSEEGRLGDRAAPADSLQTFNKAFFLITAGLYDQGSTGS